MRICWISYVCWFISVKKTSICMIKNDILLKEYGLLFESRRSVGMLKILLNKMHFWTKTLPLDNRFILCPCSNDHHFPSNLTHTQSHTHTHTRQPQSRHSLVLKFHWFRSKCVCSIQGRNRKGIASAAQSFYASPSPSSQMPTLLF